MKISIQYNHDSSTYFEHLKDLKGAVFLDSCRNSSSHGRFDIISAAPIETIVSTQKNTTIINKSEKITRTDNPLEILYQRLKKYNTKKTEDLFSGGALGYFSYDLCRKIEKIPNQTINDNPIPIMHIGIYDWAIVVDHEKNEANIIYENISIESKKIIEKISSSFNQKKPIKLSNYKVHTQNYSVSNLVWNQDITEYKKALTKIKKYIYEGDCYQVNYSQRIKADFSGYSWELYKDLRKKNPAPYSAYIKTQYGDILSSSPEQFLSVNNGTITTKPIKGTVKSSNDREDDKQKSITLKNCPKNKAENLMIVDLLRNDIGRVAIPGSIKVTKLFDIESFEGLHHLVSTINAKLPNDKNAIDLLKACFPGGSITGAPKIRSMEIIEELEKYQRGIYCGSIGYIDFNGNMDTNIAIRTTLVKDNKLYYSAGGGIVADSNIEEEYQEMKTKAQVFIDTVSGK